MAYTGISRWDVPSYELQRQRQRTIARLTVPPVLITGFFWFTSPNSISLVQGGCALTLLIIPWLSYWQWKQARTHVLPLFAFVAFFYWVYFGLALFWGDRISPGMGIKTFVSDGAVTQSMLMTVLGVMSLWLGIRIHIGARWSLKRVRDITAGPRTLPYMRGLLVVGAVLTIYPSIAYVGGEQGRQLVLALQTTVPITVFAYMFRSYLRGGASSFDKYAMALFLATSMLVGLGTGWLGQSLWVAVSCIAVYLMERRKLPLLPIALAVLFVVFFQAGKAQFRNQYWTASSQGSAYGTVVQRVSSWFESSLGQWEQTFSGQNGQFGPQMFHDSVMRLSLLTQTAHVVEYTPQVVPYQYGATYPYVVIGLIPRFVWPDKPSANDANQFYQVAYGLTSPGQLSGVSMAVGTMAESYINFGWVGIVLVMFLLGIVFDFLQESFLAKSAGLLFNAMGVSILIRLIVIESQMGVYLGGLLQNVLVVVVVLWPISRAMTAEQKTPEVVA